jgi:uncharacterized tellurite resistance protein B-like protein
MPSHDAGDAMLKRLKREVAKLLDRQGEQTDDADREHGIKLATATLLAEVARADHVLTDDEVDTLTQLLRERFALDDDETALVLETGLERAEKAVSLHEFTRLLHESLDADEKSEIVSLLWRVAAADGELDKHEDAMISRIGELLYVPRTEVLKYKHLAGL